MKKKFWHIGLGLVITGGVGMIIDLFVHRIPSIEFWILLVAFVAGVISFFISYYYDKITTLIKRIKSKIILIYRVITRIEESGRLLNLKDEQKKNPEKWLYPVIQYIDLNRQGSAHDDNDVYVTFHIDSHLLFEVREFYIFATLYLKPNDRQENQSKWYEIKKPANYAPIGQLVRYGFSDAIHLMEESDEEKCLLKWMREFRSGKPLLSMLKIGVNFRIKEDKSNPDFVLEGSRWIVPISDYRGA